MLASDVPGTFRAEASLYAALLEDAGLLAYCCPDGGVTGVAPVEEALPPRFDLSLVYFGLLVRDRSYY